MNKAIFCFMGFSLVVLVSCNHKPFVEHELKFTKQADGCETLSESFRMISNFGGERYEFTKCLPAGFEESQLEVARQGDTVMVHFPVAGQGTNNAVFNIILDIDSHPRYHFITIDEETYTLSHSDK